MCPVKQNKITRRFPELDESDLEDSDLDEDDNLTCLEKFFGPDQIAGRKRFLEILVLCLLIFWILLVYNSTICCDWECDDNLSHLQRVIMCLEKLRSGDIFNKNDAGDGDNKNRISDSFTNLQGITWRQFGILALLIVTFFVYLLYAIFVLSSNTHLNRNRFRRQAVDVPNRYETDNPNLYPISPNTASITGSSVLFSRERFYVEMIYHAESIAIFKSIPNAKYELTTRKWSFPITEHSKLVSAMECLKPNLTIGPLPFFILRIFKNSSSKGQLEADFSVLSRIDTVLVESLFQFQREGISFGVSRGGRVLIADDMGLGKTIQALGIADYYKTEWPLLIVAPSSMRYGWREAIWKWLPSVPAGSVTVIDSKADWEWATTAKILIVSYDFIQKKKDNLNFKVVIFDESHHLKNFKTARAKASVPIIQQAKRAILLSGTPALSRPMELFTQISAINRELFPNHNEYGIRYCAGKKNAWGWDYQGASNMDELQLVLEETIMIRRMKSDVLKQLPAKRRQMLILDPALVRISSKGLQSKASEFNSGKNLKGAEKQGKLLEYFSETGKAKLEAVTSYITELVEDGKKFLCFAHHRVILDGISERLDSLQYKYIRIDGRTPAEERKDMCDQFQVKDDVRVAVLSIQAANSGITLTAANLIVFAELFWNPGILTQAEDRAHRIGQEDSVLVQYLVAKGTADDYLWRLVVDKLDVLNKVGLSKDNFNDADAESLIQHLTSEELTSGSNLSSQPHGSSQSRIDSFFQPIVNTKPNAQQTITNPSVSDLPSSSSTTIPTGTSSNIDDFAEEEMAFLLMDDFDK